MKNLRKPAALALAVLLLAGCADTPSDLTDSSSPEPSRAGAEASASAESSPEAPETVPVSALKASDENAAARIISRSFDNISFADTFTVHAGDDLSVGVFKAERRTDLFDHADGLFKAAAGCLGEDYDPADTVITDQGGITEASHMLGDVKAVVFTRGGLILENQTDRELKLQFATDDTLLASFDISDKTRSEKLTLAKGEATVGALADISSGINDALGVLGLDIEVRPFSVSVMKNSYDESAVPVTVVSALKSFMGLPVFNFAYSSSNGEPLDFSYVFTDTDCFVFADGDHISSAIITPPFVRTEQLEAFSEIMSPDRAVELISQGLAEYLSLTALRLDLVYVPVAPDGAQTNENVTMTPYWQLTFSTKPFEEHYALINIQNSNVTYVEPR